MSLPDNRDLERLLESVRFEPRASLGAEVVGRFQRGERPTPPPPSRFRFLAVGMLVGVGVLGSWALLERRGGAMTVDRCCQDLDGGGAADDGLLVVSRKGTTVKRLAIYEDLDGSRSFTPADRLRFDRGGDLALARPISPAEATREFCCLDYDGGGAHDDALVVVGVAPDRISMAAIYEAGGPPGQPLRLR